MSQDVAVKKAYILLAHKAPQQLARLIGALDDGKSFFYIHLDRTCDPVPFERELSSRHCCRFVKSENGAWGQVGIVKATLNGLNAVVQSGQEYDIVSLLSGQDYPLRSNAYIDRFFELNHGKIFMEFFPMPAKFWDKGGLDRIAAYHIGDRRRRSRQKVSKWLSRLCDVSIIFKRRFPTGLRPHGGWQWWSVSINAVHEILDFVKRRPDYLRFHRWSLLPDEMVFQTILLNSESPGIRQNLVNNCLRFVDWDNPNPATPATLTVKYFDALITSKSLFARKFDDVRDAAILEEIDAYRLEEERNLQGAGELPHGDLAWHVNFPNTPACPGTKIGLFDERSGTVAQGLTGRSCNEVPPPTFA